LTRPFDKHLDSDELDVLVSKRTDIGMSSEILSNEALAEANGHVKSCQVCSRRVQMHEAVLGEIIGTGMRRDVQEGGNCIANVEWYRLAAGLLPEVETRALIKHAAQCGHCGPLLRHAADTLSDATTATEEDLLATLGSARHEWKRNLASTLSGNSQGRSTYGEWKSWWRKLFIWPVPAFVVGAILLVAVASWLGFRAFRQPSAAQLLAQAYVEHRTIEMRFFDAQYAPMHVERGAGGSSIDKSQALLKAEALIGENLKKTPNDPLWLQAKAQADLLDGNYDSSITSLQRALEAWPDASGLQTDLASAYFQRGMSGNRPADYTLAIDLLGQVLQKQPDNKTALFNRAIVFERMFLFGQAVEDWERYLRLDPSGEWSKEASERLERLKLRRQTHDKASREPMLEPAQLLERVDPRDEATWGFVDSRLEEYDHLVIKVWLRRAFPTAPEPRPSTAAFEALRALRLIATISRVKHADRWLEQLLTTSALPEFPNAISALVSAVTASEEADYASALNKSHISRELFLEMNNFAGLSRANFEEVFALHFSSNAPDCANHAAELVINAQRAHFTWITAQAQIEQGICQNSEGDYGSAKTILASAIKNAQFFGYPITEMRAHTMGGLVAWSEGNGDDAWSALTTGLERCWAGYCPAMTMYSMYANMDNFAEDSRRWYLQVPLAKEALVVLGDDPDHLMRAVEHNRLAKAAMLSHLPNLAREEFATANRLLSSVPQTDVTKNYRAGIQVDLAKLAMEEGDSRAAFIYLTEVSPRIPKIADHYLLFDYYQTLGHLQLKLHELDKARESLQWAVAFAERQLSSLQSEHDRLAWRQLSGNTYRDLVEIELAGDSKRSALGIWEWYLGIPLRSQTDGQHDSSLPGGNIFSLNRTGRRAPRLPDLDVGTRILDSLRNSTFISFAILSGRTAVWISDDRGIFFTWLQEDANEVVPLARRFRRLCSQRDVDPVVLRAVSRQLYDSLLAPIDSHFSASRTLVFEGDSELVDIPIQALIDGRGSYLADSFSVTTIPGIYYLSHVRPTSHISANDPLLAVAVSTGKGGGAERLYPLSDVLEEATEVVGKFQNARLLTGHSLDEQNLTTEIRRAVVFHFAGHASTSWNTAGLILDTLPADAAGGVLDASRLLSLRPDRVQLAVLSACSTESGSQKGLEDPDSLALAFLDAGVPHVVASRWNVDSAITVTFMASFYDALLAGNSVPQSVRQAGTLIRNQRGANLPYYWAAFSSFGTS
jgi:CHAT domain-containing protein/tetratricopeptide (TPR) repeat protein